MVRRVRVLHIHEELPRDGRAIADVSNHHHRVANPDLKVSAAFRPKCLLSAEGCAEKFNEPGSALN